ncbi:MAG: enolase C-terminal domain-like protein [Thermoplasmatales archaeon]
MIIKLDGIELYPLKIPIKPEKLSFGSVNEMHYVIVEASEKGEKGYGEAAVLQGPYWSEESIESIYYTIKNYIAPVLVGKDINVYSLENLLNRVKGNLFAKAAVEMSLFDLLGKKTGKNISDLLGGAKRERLPVSWTLASNSARTDIVDAKRMIENGFRIFKIKVGSLPLEKEIERVKKIVEELNGQVSIRVDANQGFSLKQAEKFLENIDPLNITFFEQPVPSWDLKSMSKLASTYQTPILADESLRTLQDAEALIAAKAAKGFSYKLEKSGGFVNSARIERLARKKNIIGYMGCMIETSIGTAAYANFASYVSNLEFGTELFGPLRIMRDVVEDGLVYEDGYLVRPKGAGLGIRVDVKKLKKLSVNIM